MTDQPADRPTESEGRPPTPLTPEQVAFAAVLGRLLAAEWRAVTPPTGPAAAKEGRSS